MNPAIVSSLRVVLVLPTSTVRMPWLRSCATWRSSTVSRIVGCNASVVVVRMPAFRPKRFPRLIAVSAQWTVNEEDTRIAVLTPATATGSLVPGSGHGSPWGFQQPFRGVGEICGWGVSRARDVSQRSARIHSRWKPGQL